MTSGTFHGSEGDGSFGMNVSAARKLDSAANQTTAFKSSDVEPETREMMRKSVLILVFLFIVIPIKAQNVYIAQNASGAANGADCADARPVSFFNNSANWPNPIGPGTTVHLCGAITPGVNSTALSAQSGGTAANPITILFEPGASITSPAMAIGINLNVQPNFIIDGGTTCGYMNGPGNPDTPCNGTIQNTANGTGLANNIQSDAIFESGGGLEVRNLNIINLYVHTGNENEVISCPPHPTAVYFAGAAPGMNFHNNIVHDACWALNGDADDVIVAFNDIYNMDHGIGMGTAATHVGLQFHDNHVHDPANWDTTTNSYHHDGIHLFYLESPHSAWNGTLVYNNVFDGNWGRNNTAPMAVWDNENGTLFNNVCIGSSAANWNNGCLNTSSGAVVSNMTVYNNTLIGSGTSSQYATLLQPGGTNLTVENNAVTTANTLVTTQGGTTISLFNHNVYANAGASDPFVNASGSTTAFLTLPDWQKYAGEANSSFNSTLNLNSIGVPQSGSPAIGAGANLSSRCIMNGGNLPNALCSDIRGNPRSTTGPWDAGAYSSGATSGNQPPAPSGLIAIVNN
jgi:hypothetical protein